jgi:hypothetical protein
VWFNEARVESDFGLYFSPGNGRTQDMAKVFTTLDLYLASFLSLNNLEPKLEIHGGKVLFAFEATADLYRMMTHFNENVPVPVTDFVTAVKVLRGKMLTVKEGIAGNGKGAGNGYRRDF